MDSTGFTMTTTPDYHHCQKTFLGLLVNLLFALIMIYTIPTKRGVGIELWGTYDDLRTLYEIISKFWGDQDYSNVKGYEDRNNIISYFSYELRKAYEHSRLSRNHSHFSGDSIPFYGCKLSWVYVIFLLNALRYNMKFIDVDKLDQSYLLLIEYWLEKSMKEFDAIGATKLIPYLNGGIYAGNENLYLYMRSIDSSFFQLGGGKKAFRGLGILVKKAVYGTPEFVDHLQYLIEQAKSYNCDINDLELKDDNINYDKIKW